MWQHMDEAVVHGRAVELVLIFAHCLSREPRDRGCGAHGGAVLVAWMVGEGRAKGCGAMRKNCS